MSDKQTFEIYNLQVPWDDFILAPKELLLNLIKNFLPKDQVILHAIWSRQQIKSFVLFFINIKLLITKYKIKRY
jgi:hypothetical protein